ncbi:MAG: hypothetical protein CVU05_05275 [Bacteroidetes bacterium HGW-Bacteroidetes-21]|nr:MAG: hypothetical protein CVU05_05275 [Bacteroidetes bacterium HGW-Bacteroidetes-21]
MFLPVYTQIYELQTRFVNEKIRNFYVKAISIDVINYYVNELTSKTLEKNVYRANNLTITWFHLV